eukprot:4568333-Prymnesium_polylepis.2
MSALRVVPRPFDAVHRPRSAVVQEAAEERGPCIGNRRTPRRVGAVGEWREDKLELAQVVRPPRQGEVGQLRGAARIAPVPLVGEGGCDAGEGPCKLSRLARERVADHRDDGRRAQAARVARVALEDGVDVRRAARALSLLGAPEGPKHNRVLV